MCCCVTTCREFYSCFYTGPRSQWPHGLRGGSAAAHFLGLGVRIHRHYRCLSLVFVVCFQVEISATIRPLVRRSSTEFGVPKCDLETSTMRRPRSTRTVESWNQKYRHKRIIELPFTFYPTFQYRFPYNLRQKTFLNSFFLLLIWNCWLLHCVWFNFYFHVSFLF